MRIILSIACLLLSFFSTSIALSSDKVVVVPLGQKPIGNATPADVVKDKTFSNSSGIGLTGTLEAHPLSYSFTNDFGMTFNLLPAGTFKMGSSTIELGHSIQEAPLHKVTLTKNFYIMITEVTQKQWTEVIGANNNPSFYDSCGEGCPVEQVTWYEAVYFANVLSELEGRTPCYKLTGCTGDPGIDMECTSVTMVAEAACNGFKLPTEAQWEYAARAGNTNAFHNGYITSEFSSDPNLDEIAWYMQNSGGTTHPVAQKPANNWGLHDMHGNVSEWCQDYYLSYSGPETDPQGPETGNSRVDRGGSSGSNPIWARAANRDYDDMNYRWRGYGLRLILFSRQ